MTRFFLTFAAGIAFVLAGGLGHILDSLFIAYADGVQIALSCSFSALIGIGCMLLYRAGQLNVAAHHGFSRDIYPN